MRIDREFRHEGLSYLYRVGPTSPDGHVFAELRILREKKPLGDTIFAQPQLVSYRGPGQVSEIDKLVREQARNQYGIQIPK